MNSIYFSASTIIFTMVICAVLRMFFPGEKTTKILTLILSLFALISLTSPIIDIVKEITSESRETIISETDKASKEIFDEQVRKEAGDYLSEYIYKTVCEYGFSPLGVSVNLKSDQKSGIYVDKLSICFDSRETLNEESVRSIVLPIVGVEPQIEYLEMNEYE